MSDQTPQAASRESAFHRSWAAARNAEHIPAQRPWLLAGMALGCVPVIIAGSLGPWLYRESNSRTLGTFKTDLLSGWETDGLFALIFAVVAAVAISISLLRRDGEWVAWVGFVALALCALIGLYNWDMLGDLAAIHKAQHPLNEAEVRWGVIAVAMAGSLGAVSAFFIARKLNRD